MRVNFGAIVTDSRGSHSGAVFTKTRAGATVRTKVVPRNQVTQHTTLERSNLAALSHRWYGVLSQAQRNNWATLANATPIVDLWGNTRYLAPNQLYCRVNRIRFQADLAPIDSAPADQAVTALVDLTPTITTAPLVRVAFSNTPLAATERLYIFASPNLSPGKLATNHLTRFAAVSPLAQASPYTFTAAYTARNGNPVAGRAITLNVAIMRDANGAVSASIVQITIVP